MAFGKGSGNGKRGGILRHWKLILGILAVLYLVSAVSSGRGRSSSSHERPAADRQETAAAEETAVKAQEEVQAEEKAESPAKDTKEQQEAQAEVPQSAPDNKEDAGDGIRPEFKETMDAYEKFFDDYYDFCLKYSKSQDTTSMMMDYLTWMTDYAETMEKLDEIDEGSLSPAEDAYYLEVMIRIEKKSLEAMELMGQ